MKSVMKAGLLLVSLSAFMVSGVNAIDSDQDYNHCLLCHGSNLQGNEAVGAPALAGISEYYLNRQLNNYRKGGRGADYEIDAEAAEMAVVAKQLNSESDDLIIKFISSFKNKGAIHSNLDGHTDNGKQLYEQQCAACHGDNAKGNVELLAPSLDNLNDWYLVSSFNRYRDGVRGKSDQDTAAYQMHIAAQAQTKDLKINDIAVYIRSLTTQK